MFIMFVFKEILIFFIREIFYRGRAWDKKIFKIVVFEFDCVK